MPFKMEAFTLLKACLSRCRVTHLMRTLPPSQIARFIQNWDGVLREAFEKLIGKTLPDKWWSVTRLSSKYGGMGLKFRINTAGAQHLTSLVVSSTIKRFVPNWNLKKIARDSTAVWLNKQLGVDINTDFLIDS